MRAYLKSTGEELKTRYGHVDAKFPKGLYEVVLRNTDRPMALSDPWDGGETEILMQAKRKSQWAWMVNKRLEWPPLRHGGVMWTVTTQGYETEVFRDDLHVFESNGDPWNQHAHFRATFLRSSVAFPIAPLSEVLPWALTWARDEIEALYQHMKTVAFNPVQRPKNPRVTSRFELINEEA